MRHEKWGNIVNVIITMELITTSLITNSFNNLIPLLKLVKLMSSVCAYVDTFWLKKILASY